MYEYSTQHTEHAHGHQTEAIVPSSLLCPRGLESQTVDILETCPSHNMFRRTHWPVETDQAVCLGNRTVEHTLDTCPSHNMLRKIQTHKRLKRTLVISTKRNMRILRVIPFFEATEQYLFILSPTVHRKTHFFVNLYRDINILILT